jgi:hypothetical protein
MTIEEDREAAVAFVSAYILGRHAWDPNAQESRAVPIS